MSQNISEEGDFASRIVVIGCCGAGKSTFARCCTALGYAHLELDSLVQQENWTEAPDGEVRQRIGDFIASHKRWVIDGNYPCFRNQIWSAADTVVWLDLARPVVMARLLARTLRRLATGQELWNGNRERWSNITSLDPNRSVIAWAWTRFAPYRETYGALMRDEQWSHLRWVRLRSAREVDRLLARSAASGMLAVSGNLATDCRAQ